MVYTPGTNRLNVTAVMIPVDWEVHQMVFAVGFNSSQAWLKRGETDFGLKFDQSIHGTLASRSGAYLTMDSVNYFALAATSIPIPTPDFHECAESSTAGGNCPGGLKDSLCYNSNDCGYRLYCRIGGAQGEYNHNLLRTNSSTIHHLIAVKPGLIQPAGTCVPIKEIV